MRVRHRPVAASEPLSGLGSQSARHCKGWRHPRRRGRRSHEPEARRSSCSAPRQEPLSCRWSVRQSLRPNTRGGAPWGPRPICQCSAQLSTCRVRLRGNLPPDLMSVVLPAPLWPIRPSTSPGATSRSTPSSATTRRGRSVVRRQARRELPSQRKSPAASALAGRVGLVDLAERALGDRACCAGRVVPRVGRPGTAAPGPRLARTGAVTDAPPVGSQEVGPHQIVTMLTASETRVNTARRRAQSVASGGARREPYTPNAT